MRWEATGVDPETASPEDHASILVAPADNLRDLCDLAVEINATMRRGGGGVGAEFAPPPDDLTSRALGALGGLARSFRAPDSASAQEGESIFDSGPSQSPVEMEVRPAGPPVCNARVHFTGQGCGGAAPRGRPCVTRACISQVRGVEVPPRGAAAPALDAVA